ncbi:MAG: hypothetical protein M3367_02995 [Acidobacteriota bacterium]|nr:hypothetical protein [Acidobacteriota bacterium]
MSNKNKEIEEGVADATDKNKVVYQGVATVAQNNKLSHTNGGVTTRDDVTDMGVPMLQGDGSEPQGPEDALGQGLKRGDYRNRIGGSSYQPHEVVPNKDAQPGEPTVKVVAQRPRAQDIGDEAGKKGGVETAESTDKR